MLAAVHTSAKIKNHQRPFLAGGLILPTISAEMISPGCTESR
jgi:hypothetical protein